MLMLATQAREVTAVTPVILAATWLTILLAVMCLLVIVLVPHETWTSMADNLRSAFRSLRERLSSMRSKDGDQQ